MFHCIKKKKFHPFCNGIIIRINKSMLFISTTDGIIKIGKCLNLKSKIVSFNFKQGDRLYTPNSFLEDSLNKRVKFNSLGLINKIKK